MRTIRLPKAWELRLQRPLPLSNLRLLDLCCGGGGATEGYVRSGRFRVDSHYPTGVDLKLCPNYPHHFLRRDALALLRKLCNSDKRPPFDLIHASFPCQKFTRAQHLATSRLGYNPADNHEDLVTPGRLLLQQLHITHQIHYVIENVPEAPLLPPPNLTHPLLLCGLMFPELGVWRERHFETSFPVDQPPHEPHQRVSERPWGVYGSRGDQIPGGGRTALDTTHARELMDIQTPMAWSYVREAIPPAYTEYIATFL
jgi:hypothetical protein